MCVSEIISRFNIQSMTQPTSGKAVVEEGEDDEDSVKPLQGNQQVIEGVGSLAPRDNLLQVMGSVVHFSSNEFVEKEKGQNVLANRFVEN